MSCVQCACQLVTVGVGLYDVWTHGECRWTELQARRCLLGGVVWDCKQSDSLCMTVKVFLLDSTLIFFRKVALSFWENELKN